MMDEWDYMPEIEGCEVCGAPCFGSRCSDHPDPRALSGFEDKVVADSDDPMNCANAAAAAMLRNEK